MLRRILALAFFAALLVACGAPAAAPTPTPTKTPRSAVEAQPTQTPVPATPTPEQATATPTPQGDIAPFTGLPAENPAWLKRRPLFVCINNDAVGRSVHYGLSRADVVYEYIVDGFTLTRITAMFQSRSADRIGPLRSARFPNVWMTYMYDGALACSGGSDAIRYILKNEVGFPYLDADIDDPSQVNYFFNVGTGYQTRMQTSTEGIRKWLADSGKDKEWSRPGFQFSETPPPNPDGPATVVSIRYPGGNDVEWRYDPALQGYIRFQGGQQQFDPGTGQPIVAQNIAVIAAQHTLTDIVEDSLGTKGVDIKLYDFGDLRLFRDGAVYSGTWRADPETPPRWIGPGEVILPLRPGQTWVQVVREIGEVTIQ